MFLRLFAGDPQFWYFPFKQFDVKMFRMTPETSTQTQTMANRVAREAGRIWTKASLAMAKRNARAELRRALNEDIRQQREERERERALTRSAAAGE